MRSTHPNRGEAIWVDVVDSDRIDAYRSASTVAQRPSGEPDAACVKISLKPNRIGGCARLEPAQGHEHYGPRQRATATAVKPTAASAS